MSAILFPKIVETYGKNVFEFRENSIVVNIPFNYITAAMTDKVVDKVVDKKLNATQNKILLEIRNNPNITQPQLSLKLGFGKTTIQNCISVLKKKEYIERIGSNKDGYWRVID